MIGVSLFLKKLNRNEIIKCKAEVNKAVFLKHSEKRANLTSN